MKYMLMVLITFMTIVMNNAISHDFIQGGILENEKTVMINLVNQHRLDKGLDPLIELPIASEAAKDHSEYMAFTLRGLSHDEFKRRVNTITEMIQLGVSGAAENVAYNQSIIAAHQALLNSPGHLRNIEGDYNYIGIGIVTDENERLYATQIFLKVQTPPQASAK